MADARALLRAKRQEARITHPYAAYSSSGQLRCTVCDTPVKQASMWEGHLGSKSHRVAVSKLREQEERKRAEAAAALKRKAGDDEDEEMDVDTKKRRLSDEEDEDVPMATAAVTKLKPAHGFPADFFSDPSKAPTLSVDDEDEEENSAPAQPLEPPKEKTQIDLEWEQFQAAVLKESMTKEEADEERQAAFQRATVIAEPELLPEADAGFPAAIVNGEGVPAQEEEQKEETEEEKQRRKEQEERELIMDRLIEEERAQEEADERVGLLKAKVEALKRMREARKAGKKGKTKS